MDGLPSSIGDILGRPRQPPPEERIRWSTRPMTDSEARASYATIYNGLTVDFSLKGGNEVVLVAEIDARARIAPDGWCTLSQSSFSKFLGVSIPTVSKALKSLEKKGVIERGRLTEFGTLQLRLSPPARAERENYRRYFDKKREENLKRGR